MKRVKSTEIPKPKDPKKPDLIKDPLSPNQTNPINPQKNDVNGKFKK